jgi:putative serine protease PepD
MGMTDEPPRRRSGPDRLWTDPREEDEHTRWLAPKTTQTAAHRPLREPEPPPPPPDRPLWPQVAIGLLIAFVLFGGGILGARVLRDDDNSSGGLAALPAAPGGVAPDARARAVRQIYATTRKSVVQVRVSEGGATGSGTGFVIDSNGTIVTNAHVVSGASEVQVRFNNGNGVDADVLGRDPSSDLAVVRVDSSHTQDVKPLQLADSDSVRVGDLAVAIGYPLGLDETVTAGIVSAVNGSPIKAPNGFSIDNVIQTDAPINPGNSGGPLLDGAGRVIGVNSQIATAGGGGNVGIGFAVPSNTVRQVVPRLRSGGSIQRPYVGISSIGSTVGQGALVASAVPGGPADRAGVLTGDLVTKVDGKTVRAPEDIATAIEARRPGDEIDLEVRRAGGERTLRVTLGTRPENAPSSPSGP